MKTLEYRYINKIKIIKTTDDAVSIFRLIWTFLYIRYLYYFRRKYVLESIKNRKGECQGKKENQHKVCCDRMEAKLLFGYSIKICCPYLKDNSCSIYPNIPLTCKLYPINEKHKCTKTKEFCNYYWEK